MLVDTHCHLDDAVYCGSLSEVLRRGRRAGIHACIVQGVHPLQWEAISALARSTTGIFAAFGVHPMHAQLFNDDVASALESLLPHAVATGEIGLDYSLPSVPCEAQMAAFRAQLRLSVSRGLPVSVHCRRAFPDLLRILKEEQVARVGGAMHAFSGSAEVARECMKLGMLISVAGPVTFANAAKPVEVASQIPMTSLLVETDAPDLAPEPYRGGVNEPAFMVETVRKIAAIKGLTVREVSAQTTANADTLFRLKERTCDVTPA